MDTKTQSLLKRLQVAQDNFRASLNKQLSAKFQLEFQQQGKMYTSDEISTAVFMSWEMQHRQPLSTSRKVVGETRPAMPKYPV